MWRTDSLAKTLMLGKIEGRRRKVTTEDEMVGRHHWLDGHGFEWTLGVGDGLGGLACCDSWGGKESDMTERLNWTELNCHIIPRLWVIFSFKMDNTRNSKCRPKWSYFCLHLWKFIRSVGTYKYTGVWNGLSQVDASPWLCLIHSICKLLKMINTLLWTWKRIPSTIHGASLVAQMVKILSAMQET